MRVLFPAAAIASLTGVASAQTTSPAADSFNYVLGISRPVPDLWNLAVVLRNVKSAIALLADEPQPLS